MLIRPIMFLIASSGIAYADCGPDQQVFLSCQVEGRDTQLDVCFDAERVTYNYGPANSPELVLSELVKTVAYTPWPGAGSTVWEEVAFTNADYIYTTFGAIHRIIPNDPDDEIEVRYSGGVIVMQDDDTIARLYCAPDTVVFLWGEGLSDAKKAVGLTYDHNARTWQKSAE
ncbi:MAG: hypothetical protein ABJ327_12150 [Litoreibacter sp.]